MKYIFFLGSHPSLSAAECFTVLKNNKFEPKVIKANYRWLMLEINKGLPDGFIDGLGGIDRIARVTSKLDNFPTPEDIIKTIDPLPSKFTIGISGISVRPHNLKKLSIDLKKAARASGSRLKFISPGGKSSHLNAAQVIFNSLHRDPNMEITIINDDNIYHLAKTIQIQDIASYELRDTDRPARSGRVGMLPPKLAQIMINLAVDKENLSIIDPFCGLGTVLQEGWLKGYKMTGSDSQQDMLESSKTNLNWMKKNWPNIENPLPELFQQNATELWPNKLKESFDVLVTEPYMGPPLSAPLPRRPLFELVDMLNVVYINFFRNILPIMKKDGLILFILPAWKLNRHAKSKTMLFPSRILDEISAEGYIKKQLMPIELEPFYESSHRGTLLYARPDALVWRELTLWQKS